MDRSLFLVFNHEMTPRQKEDAYTSLGVEQITDLPQDLKKLWQQVPPGQSEINGYLGPVKNWLDEKAVESDYVLIQGDFGACYIMVQFAFKKRLLPIYSTTRREAIEEYGSDGAVNVLHQFKHQIFRKYGV